MRIEHIAFNVADASAQVKWYVEHLGVEIIRQINDTTHIHFVVDKSQRVILEFYTNPAEPVPDYAAMHPTTLHIAFSVDDIVAERERLIAGGASTEGSIVQTPAGDQLAFLRDPWGMCIQLAQRQQPLLR